MITAVTGGVDNRLEFTSPPCRGAGTEGARRAPDKRSPAGHMICPATQGRRPMSYTAGPKVGTASTRPSSASASITWKTLMRGTLGSSASCALLADLLRLPAATYRPSLLSTDTGHWASVVAVAHRARQRRRTAGWIGNM